MNIQDFKKHSDWQTVWAGTWSFLSCSYFGDSFTEFININGHPPFKQTIIIVQKNKSYCAIRESERIKFGKYLAKNIITTPGRAPEVCLNLNQAADKFIGLINKLSRQSVDAIAWKEFCQELFSYYGHHIYIKYVIDFLEPKLLSKLFSQLENARVYAEPVFKRTEDLTIKVAKQISRAQKISLRLALCYTYLEVQKYLETGVVVSRPELVKRYNFGALLFDSRGFKVFTGIKAGGIEKFVTRSAKTKSGILKGACAYTGKVRGIARLVPDPAKVKQFNPGDILIAGMTRPGYLPLMKKAGAMVTDGGGLLCHAAIMARELKIPCVIGTKIATKIFKTGDLLEVDAKRGTVKKI